MDLKDISGMFASIDVFNNNLNEIILKLNALDEDLGIDRYQDTQPGGGNYEYINRKKYDEYSKRLNAFSLNDLFGDIYVNGTNEEKQLLEHLTSLVDESPDYYYMTQEADNILYDSISFHIIDTVVDNYSSIANQNLTTDLLDKLFSISSL